MTLLLSKYILKAKQYDIEYKLGVFNVFSKEKPASEVCKKFDSSSEIPVYDFPEHTCSNTEYYLTFKPTLWNTPIDLEFIRDDINEEACEKNIKLEREIGTSGMDFSDDIEDLGYIIKTEEVTCSSKYSTFDEYKESVYLLNIISLTIVSSIFLGVCIYKKIKKKKHMKQD